jgi:transcriptional regulator with XRE-family HTH domain
LKPSDAGKDKLQRMRERVEVVQPQVVRRLRWFRRNTRTTQQQVATAMRRLGFEWDRITVVEVEAGRRDLRVDELAALAELWDEPIANLLDRAGVDAALVNGRDGQLGKPTGRTDFFARRKQELEEEMQRQLEALVGHVGDEIAMEPCAYEYRRDMLIVIRGRDGARFTIVPPPDNGALRCIGYGTSQEEWTLFVDGQPAGSETRVLIPKPVRAAVEAAVKA